MALPGLTCLIALALTQPVSPSTASLAHMCSPNGMNMKKRMQDLMTKLHICENALILIASWDCENYRTGIGSCYRARRTEDASETSKRCCAPCVAHKTLMSYK